MGSDKDHWIEMKNVTGKWEKSGLIFGYDGANDECLKAISGRKEVNYKRECRCSPAN